MNSTLVEAVRSMLSDSKLPKTFWAEALSTAGYVRYRCPALKDMTLYEALIRHKPSVKHYRTFGCISHVHIPKDEREKLDLKPKRCIFLVYGSTTRGYCLCDLEVKKVLHSRGVIFDEIQSVSFKKTSLDDSPCKPKCVEFETAHEEDDKETIEPEINLRHSTRDRKAPNRLGEWVNSCTGELDDPSTVEEGLSDPGAETWRGAMQNEMNLIASNNVWTLVVSSKECKPINCKWIFKKKIGPDGTVCSYKARLVAQGFSQKPGIYYNETFSPVVRYESVRTVLALAAQHNLQVHQLDVSFVFVNGELSEVLYMTQLEGFIEKGKVNLVCKLKKTIDGLKQAPNCWNSSLHSCLKSLKFHQCSSDSCICTC